MTLKLPLAGYSVPATVSTREEALHCFACGGALTHSCTCERISLHKDDLLSLIYWVQQDTVDAANRTHPLDGDVVELDRPMLGRFVMQYDKGAHGFFVDADEAQEVAKQVKAALTLTATRSGDGELRIAAQTIFDKFTEDHRQGYRSSTRTYVLDMLKPALSSIRDR